MRRLILALAYTPTFALADVQSCKPIENDVARLACFDAAVQDAGKAAEEVGNDMITEWEVQYETSPIDDSKSVVMLISSKEDMKCGYGDQYPAALFVRCSENTTSVYIATSCYMADHQGYGDVTIRLDQQKAFTTKFNASTDNSALGAWNGRRAIPLLKKMGSANSLIARFTPVNESPQTATFNISGIQEGLKQVADTCSWKLN